MKNSINIYYPIKSTEEAKKCLSFYVDQEFPYVDSIQKVEGLKKIGEGTTAVCYRCRIDGVNKIIKQFYPKRFRKESVHDDEDIVSILRIDDIEEIESGIEAFVSQTKKFRNYKENLSDLRLPILNDQELYFSSIGLVYICDDLGLTLEEEQVSLISNSNDFLQDELMSLFRILLEVRRIHNIKEELFVLDIKPDNICHVLIDDGFKVPMRLIDFGSIRSLDEIKKLYVNPYHFKEIFSSSELYYTPEDREIIYNARISQLASLLRRMDIKAVGYILINALYDYLIDKVKGDERLYSEKEYRKRYSDYSYAVYLYLDTFRQHQWDALTIDIYYQLVNLINEMEICLSDDTDITIGKIINDTVYVLALYSDRINDFSLNNEEFKSIQKKAKLRIHNLTEIYAISFDPNKNKTVTYEGLKKSCSPLELLAN